MVYDMVEKFKPDMGFVFGSSIIKDPLLSLIPTGKFVNLHLGLSPYYRGSGTNFWPFVNEELEYVGSTLLHIDAGVDTGDIICHVRPDIEHGDTVHSIGCKTIAKSAPALVRCLEMTKAGKELPRVKQWDVPDGKYYKTKDVTKEVLERYDQNLQNGLIEKHLQKERTSIRLIGLT
jgi:methionyl-tRNA formyltransferase